jgi:Kef-type K+ transport system membrane component KefB
MTVVHALEAGIHCGFVLPFLLLALAITLGPRIAQGLRLPGMVGLVLTGTLLGPHGLKLLDGHEIALQAWGQFGLLYLMFSAALDLDLGLLARRKKGAIVFALLSFAFPFALGCTAARLLGYPWPAAMLMGSNWGSHTLVTYPLLRALGLGRDPAVATVVGATPVTDTTSLLVLSAVSFHTRSAGSLGAEAVRVGLGLAALLLWGLLALPRLARWFFAEVGGERTSRLAFAMVALLSGALVAEAGSIDAIVGAFFAGMGLARVVPEKSPLMEQVQFLGAALFIPTFLVSVGVLLDPRVMVVPRTMMVALFFIGAVLGGKTLAAVVAGRALRFAWPEVAVMSGLSGSQAAATLATTLVGVHLGVFDRQTFNAVLLVVLVTLVVTPVVVSHFAHKLARGEGTSPALGSSVLLAIRDEHTRDLLRVASRIAETDGGMVLPVTIATEGSPADQTGARRRLARAADEWLARAGFESRGVFRFAESVEAGLRETALAEEATLLMMEWPSSGSQEAMDRADRVASEGRVPVLLARGRLEGFSRLLLLVTERSIAGRRRADLELASNIAQRLAGRKGAIYVCPPAAPLALLYGSLRRLKRIECRDGFAWIQANARDDDVLVFPGLDVLREALERDRGVVDRPFLVALRPKELSASLSIARPSP